jgi:hypothetical protein
MQYWPKILEIPLDVKGGNDKTQLLVRQKLEEILGDEFQLH